MLKILFNTGDEIEIDTFSTPLHISKKFDDIDPSVNIQSAIELANRFIVAPPRKIDIVSDDTTMASFVYPRLSAQQMIHNTDGSISYHIFCDYEQISPEFEEAKIMRKAINVLRGDDE